MLIIAVVVCTVRHHGEEAAVEDLAALVGLVAEAAEALAVLAALVVAVAFREEEEQVEAGKTGSKKDYSPIVLAIMEAEKGTTGEIRVHLSKRWFEKDPYAHACKLFMQYGMTRTANRNAVLLYVNLRKRKFTIIGDEGIHRVVGQQYWEELARCLANDLRSTCSENAIALAVRTIGATLHRFFPAEEGAENPDELSNDVTTD